MHGHSTCEVKASNVNDRPDGWPLQKICIMGCITPEGELERIMRQLQRCVGPLSGDQQTRTRKLSLSPLETPTEALLTFQRPADLDTCLDDSGHSPQS